MTYHFSQEAFDEYNDWCKTNEDKGNAKFWNESLGEWDYATPKEMFDKGLKACVVCNQATKEENLFENGTCSNGCFDWLNKEKQE